jgi:phage shock protein A
MANPFVKTWKYLMAAFSSKVDELADPKVQIQQAIEEAQHAHQALSQQAAAVIGNQRQLEMKLNRQLGEVEKMQASARQALVLADEARAKGDDAKATEFENAAQMFATNLVTAEQAIEDLKTLHDQLEQAKMQEQVSKSLNQMSELAAPTNVPSLDEVRDKIEKRYATALGSADLAKNSVQGRMLEVQQSTVNMAGSNRLEQIRASLHGGSVAPQITSGNANNATPANIQQEIAQRVQQTQKQDKTPEADSAS